MKQSTTGHIAAFFTIVLWGTTFISTKVLLSDFTPVEILFIRFVIGFIALWIAYPRLLHIKDKKQELLFFLAGLCGICLYFLMENIALTYTLASNIGVIISIAPFFTAILSRIFFPTDKSLHANFFIGFLCAMAGICIISFNGSSLHFDITGDLLALGASFVWACYSLLTKKLSTYEYATIPMTRRIFTYGLICIIPALFFLDFSPNIDAFFNITNTFNFIYLGLGASATCFVTWNFAVKTLGALKTSIYIYLVPVVTIVTSFLILRENVTYITWIGAGLTILGLFLSESTCFIKK
ncbi:MAG: DMT family transporter [Longicatena sp.]